MLVFQIHSHNVEHRLRHPALINIPIFEKLQLFCYRFFCRCQTPVHQPDRFIRAAAGRVIGMDVMGDWSRPRTKGVLRSVLNITEHPALRVHPQEAAAVNGRTNQALIETVARAMAPAIPPAATRS